MWLVLWQCNSMCENSTSCSKFTVDWSANKSSAEYARGNTSSERQPAHTVKPLYRRHTPSSNCFLYKMSLISRVLHMHFLINLFFYCRHSGISCTHFSLISVSLTKRFDCTWIENDVLYLKISVNVGYHITGPTIKKTYVAMLQVPIVVLNHLILNGKGKKQNGTHRLCENCLPSSSPLIPREKALR